MLDLLLWLKDCGCSLDEITTSASNCVVSGQITKDNYKTIVGEDYEAPTTE